MYLTSGAKVSTRRSRTARSSVRRYSFHRARVSSEDRRRLVGVASFTGVLLKWVLPGGRRTYRCGAERPKSPVAAATAGASVGAPLPTSDEGRPSGPGQCRPNLLSPDDEVAGRLGGAVLAPAAPRVRTGTSG